MTVFVSYARQDEAIVVQLCADLERLERDVWYDQHIAPAERWWDEILEQIRACDLFVVALSPSWRDSRPCQAELQYALDLHRPLLPVLVGAVEMETVRPEVAATNYCDFTTEDDHASALDLALALARAPVAEPLPEPLPPAPAAPTNNIAHIAAVLQRPDLTFVEQRRLLDELLGLLNAGETRDLAREHLDQLWGRPDVVASVKAAIEGLGPLGGSSTSTAKNFPRLESLQISIDAGTCTPVLGPGLTDSLIGPRRGLAKQWAKRFDFPMAQHQIHDLPQVAQFVKVQNDAPTLRSALSQYLREKLIRDYPDAVTRDLGLGHLDEMLTLAWQHKVDLDDGAATSTEPHMVLARLPLPLFITAQPSNLLAHALEAAGKEPVVEFCRWRGMPADWPKPILKARDPYEPSIDKPMVFHLFGNLNYPESLVLTEDDYFDFLITVTRNRKLIPPCVLTALSRSALMFLGFGVEQWEFRVLLRSLVSPEAGRQAFAHVAAQINLAESVISPEAARRYLEKYFAQFNQMKIDICWASVDEFLEMFARSSEPVA